MAIDNVLDILGHPLRRELIAYCRNTSNDGVMVRDLVDHLVQVDGPYRQRDRIALELRHNHLPKLAENGVIEYDPRAEQLRYRPDDSLEEWLGRIRAEESE